MAFEIEERHDIPLSFDDEMTRLSSWLSEISSREKEFIISKDKTEYWNIPMSFDIETSSWKNGNGDKEACMYCFVYGVYGKVFVGRTWNEFLDMLGMTETMLSTSDRRLATIYVHNLSYEFQWIRKLMEWKDVFAIDQRQPVKCVTKSGIIFRCSYLLSGYSLKKVGEHLHTYHVEKKSGDLDYNLVRHSSTPLTAKEWGYVYNDGLVVMAYIQEEIEDNKGKITNIPMTKTGYVRRYMRDCCYQNHTGHKNHKYGNYRDRMLNLTMTADEYTMAHQAFQGGFTHANALYTNNTISDVTSMDFTSSYPSVMLDEMYPMSKGRFLPKPTREQFEYIQKYYLSLFYVEFNDVKTKMIGDNPISVSKCIVHDGVVVDNGRVVRATKIVMCITNIDYKVYKAFYDIGSERIGKLYYYEKNYLPTDFVKGIIKLYKDKTELKGVEGSEVEYMKSKAQLNACYGMCVTNIIRDEQVYSDNEWKREPCSDIESEIEKYNKSKSRFLSYLWGVWVTAYARRNLFTAIYTLKDDYIYSDTDSVKIRNYDIHRKYFEDYNENVRKKLRKAMEYHRIPFDDVEPKTIKGETKLIGVWDFDGHYRRFRTLGAKRYLVEHDDGSLGITISGVTKKNGIEYLMDTYHTADSVFDHFTRGLVFPSTYRVKQDGRYIQKEGSGKYIHTYIDEPTDGKVTDYLGNTAFFHEKSSIYMESTSYDMSMTDEYMDFFTGIQKHTRGV